MIDLPDFTPADAMAPTRAPSGAVILPRMTTTEEQYSEVIEFLTQAANEHKESALTVKVRWPRTDPTILEAHFQIEHLDGKRVWMLDRVVEFTERGGVVQPDDKIRLRVLNDEVAQLHDGGML